MNKLLQKKQIVITIMATRIMETMLWSLNNLPAKSDVIMAPIERTEIVELTARLEIPKSSLIGFINKLAQLDMMPIAAAITRLQAITIIHP